ncbi:hypothetical protein [Streptomyces sp. NBC_00690]|uniref:hypothetical protein n=1 Tax=Streptomyces sp. NBC_00690 TaxID=2975808 RepID=UPI002E29E109|nr:hypothetical protein [Streptomyces sp. NBC_00690]
MKPVEWRSCGCSPKRGFADLFAAEKALGRAQAKRDRHAERLGVRRGLAREHRIYGCEHGLFHLTKQNRRHRGVVA